MPLTNIEVLKRPEVDDAIVVKADDGKERVFIEIPRIVLVDYFPQRSLAREHRLALVESNIDAIIVVMRRKYANGEWRTVPRYGSLVRQITDLTMDDLRSAPPLSDARLVIEERAGFQARL